MAIIGCKDKRTAAFLAGERMQEFEGFTKAATKALTRLQAACVLGDLRLPPANNFEALGGKRAGQYSIRINRQWRVCFKWIPRAAIETSDLLMVEGDADNVEITDYH